MREVRESEKDEEEEKGLNVPWRERGRLEMGNAYTELKLSERLPAYHILHPLGNEIHLVILK